MPEINRLECSIRLEIEGLGDFGVSQFSSDWAINQIPKALCAVAVGRSAADGKTPAAIHKQLKKITKLLKAKVWFRPIGQWSNKTDWPNKEIVVFDGRVLGTGFRKSFGQVSFVIHLIHWLADLNYSSAVSGTSHPSNPVDYTFQAIANPLVQAGTTAQSSGIGLTDLGKSVTPAAIQEDLWANAIKPMFVALANAEHVRISGRLSTCVGLLKQRNDQALAALARIEGETDDDTSLSPSNYTSPLSLDTGDSAISIHIGSAIARTIRMQSIQSFASTTLWGKLVGEYAPEFMFGVVPLVNKALVIPFMPGLNSAYCKEIKADDYDYIELNAELKRAIRATAVFNQIASITSVTTGTASGSSWVGIGGCFSPDDEETDDGMLLFVAPPTWLASVSSSGFRPSRTTGVASKKAISSASTPRTVDPELRGSEDEKTKEDVIKDAVVIFNNFAHAMYTSELLRGRIGNIAGKLRFDIAPGSTIGIEGTGEAFLGVDDDHGRKMYGTVVQVAVSINAEMARAGTGFTISHVRTAAELEDDKTAVSCHPLYLTKFLGAPLIDAYQFPEGADCDPSLVCQAV